MVLKDPMARSIFPLAAAALSVLLTTVACQSDQVVTLDGQGATPPPPAAAPTPEKTAAAGGVFDPNNPPPGWLKCHRNHCHHEDGRVASYAQVMKETGTTMAGGAAPEAAPAAPADVAAAPADAEKTPSGLASRVLKAGSGSQKPGPTSKVTVHYTGWTTDGKSFDSSITRGQPSTFPLNRVIPGWTEGMQLMVVGEERRFWIPEELAYKGKPGKPAGMLVFDVELLAVD
jgi:FKBP-type peptidyl-prolyl cis-trans isomerase